jgi:hypothetical protein
MEYRYLRDEGVLYLREVYDLPRVTPPRVTLNSRRLTSVRAPITCTTGG